jgi:hypothetical protein
MEAVILLLCPVLDVFFRARNVQQTC